MSEVLIYTTDDGVTKVDLRLDQGTVWLSQQQIATLFEATKQNISLHLKNIFAEGELGEASVVKESLTTASDGKDYRTKQNIKLYLKKIFAKRKLTEKATVKQSLTVQMEGKP